MRVNSYTRFCKTFFRHWLGLSCEWIALDGFGWRFAQPYLISLTSCWTKYLIFNFVNNFYFGSAAAQLNVRGASTKFRLVLSIELPSRQLMIIIVSGFYSLIEGLHCLRVDPKRNILCNIRLISLDAHICCRRQNWVIINVRSSVGSFVRVDRYSRILKNLKFTIPLFALTRGLVCRATHLPRDAQPIQRQLPSEARYSRHSLHKKLIRLHWLLRWHHSQAERINFTGRLVAPQLTAVGAKRCAECAIRHLSTVVLLVDAQWVWSQGREHRVVVLIWRFGRVPRLLRIIVRKLLQWLSVDLLLHYVVQAQSIFHLKTRQLFAH